MSVFTNQELQRRSRELRARMQENRIDCLLAFQNWYSYWISGAPCFAFNRACIPVIPLDGEASYILSAVELRHAEEHSWIRDYRSYTDSEAAGNAISRLAKEILSEKNLTQSRIGVDMSYLSLSDFQSLERNLPEAEFVDVSDMLTGLVLILSDEEINLETKACEISVKGMAAYMDAAREGRSEVEVLGESHRAMEHEVASRFAECEFTTSYLAESGLATLSPHATCTGKKLKKGDLIVADIDASLWGYMGVTERTIVVGTVSEEQRLPFRAMLEAFTEASKAVRPGQKFSDLEKLTQAIFRKYGYDNYVWTGTGSSHYTLGIARMHGGDIRLYNNRLLEEGMCLTIQPAIYVPNIGAFRHCNTIVVTKEGCKNLTPFEEEILEV